MIIVKTEDISSAIKQAKVMIKPGSLVLENSLRFSAKKDKLYIRTNSGGIKFITRIPCTMVGIFFVKRIEFFFSKILKEGVFDYLNSLTQADLERTKKYSDIEWSEALNEEAKRMPGFADTLIKKTEIESKAKGKVKGKAEKL